MDWLKLAINLPIGHSKRLNCWFCAGKSTMSITNQGTVFFAHCFRCKEKESKAPPPMTPQERRALELAAATFQASEPALPADFTETIPVQGLLWLTKGGLHVNDVKQHGFGWSERMQRVIMPVYVAGGLVAVQARSVSKAVTPKYLSQSSVPRPYFRATPVTQTSQGTGQVVLTEDILSAARVGKVNEAWGLLGTNLMDAVITALIERNFDMIHIWMDDDKAGIDARRKMLVQLKSVGLPARLIKSDRDPKLHTLQEIKDLL